MKKLSIIIAASLVFFLFSCGEKIDEIKKVAEIASNAEKYSEQAAKSTDEAEKIIKERKAKGDTLAMPYKELQAYLPASIDGYTVDNTDGQSTQMGEFSLSNGKRNFKKADGSFVEVELTDYNMAYGIYQSIAFWAMANISSENDEEMQKTFKPGYDRTVGFETLKKKDSKNAEVVYAIGYRFILRVTADKQNSTDFVKQVAEKVNIKKLSKM